MGYDQSYDSWEPYANLRDSTHHHSYLREKNLTQFILTKFRQVNHLPERNLASYEDFLPLLLSLMPLLFQSLDSLLVLAAEEEGPDDCPALLISPFSSLKFGIQSLSPAVLTNRPWASEPI